MNATDRRPVLAAFLAGIGLMTSACRGGQVEPTAMPTSVAEGPTATATVVRRRLPTPTPTVDPAANPLFPIELDALPGIVVPIGARVVETIEATDDADARIDFALPPDTTIDDMTAWFREQMPEQGWEESEERDGALVFLHDDQISERYASEGLKRTALILFDTLSDDVDFSVLAEAAKP